MMRPLNRLLVIFVTLTIFSVIYFFWFDRNTPREQTLPEQAWHGESLVNQHGGPTKSEIKSPPQAHSSGLSQSTLPSTSSSNNSVLTDNSAPKAQPAKISPLQTKITYLTTIMDSIPVGSPDDPDGSKLNRGLFRLDEELENFLADSSFSRTEKVDTLWTLANQFEHDIRVSHVLSQLEGPHPFELTNEVINKFVELATEGDASTIVRLELLDFLKSSLKNDQQNLIGGQAKHFEKQVKDTKEFLKQQLWNFEHPALFKDELRFYYEHATLEEAIEISPRIADILVEAEPHLTRDFYAVWAESIFARIDLQPTAKILFNSPLPPAEKQEVNNELYEVLKNRYAGDISEEIRGELVDYVKNQEPSSENSSSYFNWLSAYSAIQTLDETAKNVLLGDMVANTLSQPLLQAHAVKYFGTEVVVSTWRKEHIPLLIENFNKALSNPQLSVEDKTLLKNVHDELLNRTVKKDK